MRPLPDDFTVHSAVEGNLKLRKRYRCSGRQIDAWRKESGVIFAAKTPAIKSAPKPKKIRNAWRDDDYFAIVDGFDEFGVGDLYPVGLRGGLDQSW